MTADDLEAYLLGLGLQVETITGDDGAEYTAIRDVEIPAGGFAGRTCDVAIARIITVPYLLPAAIHTRPPLLPMQGGEPFGTQPSSIGPEWQYWSRRFDRVPTPTAIWTHILTVLSDDRWRSN